MWRILSVGVFVSLQWSVVLICVLMRLHLTGAASCLFYFEGKATRLPVDFGNCRQISDLKFPVSLKPLNTKNIKTSTMLLQHLNVNVVFFLILSVNKSQMSLLWHLLLFLPSAGSAETSSKLEPLKDPQVLQVPETRTQSKIKHSLYFHFSFICRQNFKTNYLWRGVHWQQGAVGRFSFQKINI